MIDLSCGFSVTLELLPRQKSISHSMFVVDGHEGQDPHDMCMHMIPLRRKLSVYDALFLADVFSPPRCIRVGVSKIFDASVLDFYVPFPNVVSAGSTGCATPINICALALAAGLSPLVSQRSIFHQLLSHTSSDASPISLKVSCRVLELKIAFFFIYQTPQSSTGARLTYVNKAPTRTSCCQEDLIPETTLTILVCLLQPLSRHRLSPVPGI